MFTSTVEMSGQHLAQRKLSEKDQKLLDDCRVLISNAKFQPKGEYSECVTGELDKVLKKLEQFDIVKVRDGASSLR